MARLRLFANLRELAGTSVVELEADTVGGLLEKAAESYGLDFRRSMRRARVWVNGEPAAPEDAVDDQDEVALIPPVSGGAGANSFAGIDLHVSAPLVTVAVLILANLPASPEWFVTALVAVGAVWAVDLVDSARMAGVDLQLPPLLATILIGAIAPYGMANNTSGVVGLGLVVVFALVAAFVWAIAAPQARDVMAVANTALAQVIAGTGIGSLVLTRLSPDGRARVGAFLVIIVLSAAAWWTAGRGKGIGFLDPFAAGALAAVIGAVLAAWLWNLGALTFLFVGVVMALALIAGRGFGAMVRTGEVYLVDHPPGYLTLIDGPALAAAAFYPILQLVL
jgi:molybdopterin converting factor small subunit